MKTSDATLQATLYNDVRMVQADLVDLDLAVGHQYWTTSWSQIVVGGHTYLPNGPVIERGSIHSGIGTEVATCDLKLKGRYVVSGRTLTARARSGEFDNRDVAYRRVYMPTWAAAPSMEVDVFTGRVAEVLFTSFGIELRLKSIMYKTEEKRPLRVVQPMCPWVLYSSPCGAVENDFKASDVVASGSTAVQIVLTTGTTFAVPGATINFGSGSGLDGVIAVIRAYDSPSKTATLVTALSSAPTVGGSLTVSRGCDRTRATCALFGRLISFGGFPDMPSKQP